MEFKEVVEKRISIRKFKDQPVEQEKIDQLIEWMRIAPSAMNRQEWKFVAVTDPDLLAEMRVCCESRGPAMTSPCIFAIVATEYKQLNDSGWNRAAIDCSIATTYLHLATFDLGLGSCWVGSFDPDMADRILGVPEGWHTVTVVPIGYPDEDPAPRPRKSFEDVAVYNHF